MVVTCDASHLDVAATCKYVHEDNRDQVHYRDFEPRVRLCQRFRPIMVSLFGIMNKLGVSVSTGYDWTKVSSEVKEDEESIEVKVSVPPGKVLYVKQVVGLCDGNTAKTEMFQLSEASDVGGRPGHQRAANNGNTELLDMEDSKCCGRTYMRQNLFLILQHNGTRLPEVIEGFISEPTRQIAERLRFVRR